MNKAITVRRGDFLPFAGIENSVYAGRLREGVLPFYPDAEGGQRRFSPADFLAWKIMDHLTKAYGCQLNWAAEIARDANLEMEFLKPLSRGDRDVFSKLLVVTRTLEADGNRLVPRSGGIKIVNPDELAHHLFSAAGEENWEQWNEDGEITATRKVESLGVESLIAVGLVQQWRQAIDRASRFGIDLSPGAATLTEG